MEMRAILVGCGSISRTWLKAAREIQGLRLVGLVDLDLDAARQRAQEFGLHDVILSDDLSTTLARAKPDILFDCTIPEAHVTVTLEALSHGCHVLGEKPMADTLANAEKMVAAAHRAGKTYAVIQNYRYNPNVRRLRAFLQSGEIGQITSVHSDFFIGAHFGGFRDHMPHVLLLDMAIHTFDAARFITGADPLSVYCREWNPAGSWYDHAPCAAAIFELTGGIIYTYRGSWCAEGLNTAWSSEWRVVGEKGSVRWDGEGGFRAQVVAASGGFRSDLRDVELTPYADEAKSEGHASLMREFLDAVRSGTVPETVCTDNIKSLRMALGAVESAARNISVNLTAT